MVFEAQGAVPKAVQQKMGRGSSLHTSISSRYGKNQHHFLSCIRMVILQSEKYITEIWMPR